LRPIQKLVRLTRISAVSYLNTCPLVWGLTHGPQTGIFELRFELPAVCAHSLELGSVDIGLVPVIEAFRQDLEITSSVCISSDGPVRSIFLVYRKPLREIRTVALDSSSRTSVALLRILLAERYGVRAVEHQAAPDVREMLQSADAALLIGDPALKLSIQDSHFEVLDLGAEWKEFTGLPMVYAVWAGKPGNVPTHAGLTLRDSYEWGKSHIDEIIGQEAAKRGVPSGLAREYLTMHIRYELDEEARKGMHEFERLAGGHGLISNESRGIRI